jgi:hypothetical protein
MQCVNAVSEYIYILYICGVPYREGGLDRAVHRHMYTVCPTRRIVYPYMGYLTGREGSYRAVHRLGVQRLLVLWVTATQPRNPAREKGAPRPSLCDPVHWTPEIQWQPRGNRRISVGSAYAREKRKSDQTSLVRPY